MFTGIVQAVATIDAIADRPGLRTFTLRFPEGFCTDLAIGASVACDGVCLTVTQLLSDIAVEFDVMQQTLSITTLGQFKQGDKLNVERAAKDGAEIGGHPLSGHVDFNATLAEVIETENNYRLRIDVPEAWRKYVFAKGYIAINGASLTVADFDRASGRFDVWLIPETLRMTTFGEKQVGSALNIEIERSTQVVVDTVRATVAETLGPLMPALEAFLAQQGSSLELLGQKSLSVSDRKN